MVQKKKPATHRGGTNQTLRDAAFGEFAVLEKNIKSNYRKRNLRKDLDKYIKTGDAYDFIWHEPFILESLIAMYEAAGDTRYMKEIEDHADDIFANRADRRKPKKIKDGLRNCMMPGWVTAQYPKPKTTEKSYAWLVHQGMITYPIARWVYLVRRDAALKRYRRNAKTYLQNIIDIMWHPEFEAQVHHDGDEIYYDNDLVHDEIFDKESEEYKEKKGKPLPFNMQNAAGRTFVMLYLLTKDKKYQDRAAGLARFFKNRLELKSEPNGDRYAWTYRTYGTWNPMEDVPHAAINVDFAYQCYEAGIVFDETDMIRFTNTFRHICHGASGATDNVDGGIYKDSQYDRSIGRWMRLAHFDPSIRPIYWSFYNAFKDSIPLDQAALLSMAHLANTSPPSQNRTMVSVFMGDVDIKDDLFLVEPGNGHTEYAFTPDADENQGINVKVRRTTGYNDLYFYLDVADNLTRTSKIDITIRYYDNGTGILRLDYDCTDGTVYKKAEYESRTGTNTWKTWTVHIEDAALAGNMYRGADFRIGRYPGNAPLYLDSITVKAVG